MEYKNNTGIFNAQYRAQPIGIVHAVTIVAFEGLAITTIAPSLAQIVGTMVIGQRINRIGLFASFIVSILLFVISIVVRPYP